VRFVIPLQPISRRYALRIIGVRERFMSLIEAIQRFSRRSWPVCLGLAFAFMVLTAIRAIASLIMDRADWMNSLKAVALAPVVGVAFGFVIAAIARSEHRLYAKELRFDVFGLAGGLSGPVIGGFLGFIDRDNQFRGLESRIALRSSDALLDF
jgi:hypothetical protein